MAVVAKFVRDIERLVVFVFRNRYDAIVKETIGVGIEEIGFAEDRKEASEANGAADAREGLVGKVFGKVVVATTTGYRADIKVFW